MIHQRFTCKKRYYKINYERLAKQKQGGKKKDKQYCEDNIEKLQKKLGRDTENYLMRKKIKNRSTEEINIKICLEKTKNRDNAKKNTEKLNLKNNKQVWMDAQQQ